ncbi:L-histidine N(alpha)-methyltransferase [Rickettsiales bacterium]|nr:L-histidine N(alpha)-methyltransferase [Rickettsiales bacterium]
MNNLNFLKIYENESHDEREDVIKGLKDKKQKKINSKYFYDDKGSVLFDKITKLSEYYPTKTEISILEKQKKIINEFLPSAASIIEFGSGSNKKIKKLLKALKNPIEYLPIDISEKFLFENAKEFARIFPKIKVTAICADFNQVDKLKEIVKKKKKKIGFFPGSTIGNFMPDKARELLENFSNILGENNFLVIGVDLRKNKKIMEDAYNDSQGVTAKFNINILERINIEHDAFFDTKKFEHNAFFNKKENRIEMHLVSKINQSVDIYNGKINFQKGESIHTENSYKYSKDEFSFLSEEAGFRVKKVLTDEKDFFGIFFLKVKNSKT